MAGKAKDRPLSIRERALVKAIVSGEHTTVEAALLSAGYSESVARTQPAGVIGKPRLQSAILQAMDKAGISDDKLAETLKGGLEADKPLVQGTGKHTVVDFIPDHANRHKFLDTALKLRKDYPDNVDNGDGAPQVPVQILVKKFVVNMGGNGDNNGGGNGNGGGG